MSRPPRRKRPNRVTRWEGLVEDVKDGEIFARLVRVGAPRLTPELWTVIELKRLPSAEAGMLFNVYIHRRGKKVRTVLRERDLGVWTEEEIAAVKARAARMAAAIREGSDW